MPNWSQGTDGTLASYCGRRTFGTTSATRVQLGCKARLTRSRGGRKDWIATLLPHLVRGDRAYYPSAKQFGDLYFLSPSPHLHRRFVSRVPAIQTQLSTLPMPLSLVSSVLADSRPDGIIRFTVAADNRHSTIRLPSMYCCFYGEYAQRLVP
jgi:hypothetical protein